MDKFAAIFVIFLLTWAAVSIFGSSPDISTTAGDTVNIPCVFGEGTLRNIYWYYNDGTGPQKILFLREGVLAIDPEYADRANLQNDNATLILKDIAVADEGIYRCDVDRQGQTPVPNINTKLNVFSLRPDTLPVITNCTGESASCIIQANQSPTLTCILPNVYPVEDTELIWYQDGKRVSYTDEVTQNDDGTADISRHIQVSETGNFTCNATYLSANGRENTAVSIQVLITPPAGRGMTSGQITWITIGILLLVCILLAIITLTIYYLKTRAGDGDPSTPQNNNGDPEQDQDVTTPLMPLPNTTNSPSTATTTPAAAAAAAATTTTIITTYSDTAFTTSTSNHPQRAGDGDPSTPQNNNGDPEQDQDVTTPLMPLPNTTNSPSTATTTPAAAAAATTIITTTSDTAVTTSTSNHPQKAKDFDDILEEVAKRVRKNLEIDKLGRKLGFSPEDIEGYNATNHKTQNITNDGTLQMLRDWRERQTNLTEQAALKTALEQSGQIRLADDLFTFTEGDPTTPHKNNGDPEQDQDVTTPLMLLPNTTNSPSTATATPAAAAAAAAITTTITATSNTDVTSSTSNYPQKDFDDILEEVAKRVRKNLEIDKLGRKLGFSPEDIEGYNATNHKSQNITYDGTLQMLRDWRERQTNLTERAALKNALEQSGKNRLADDLFPSSQ